MNLPQTGKAILSQRLSLKSKLLFCFFFYLELLWVPVPTNNQPGGQGKPRQGEDGTWAACPMPTGFFPQGSSANGAGESLSRRKELWTMDGRCYSKQEPSLSLSFSGFLGGPPRGQAHRRSSDELSAGQRQAGSVRSVKSSSH